MRKNIVIVVIVVVVILVSAVAVYFMLKPSFIVSVSPSTLNIPKGGSENITVSYDPQVPFNLSSGFGVSGPSPGVQVVASEPPFTFSVIVSENAALGTYTVTMEAIDMNTGARATTTFTVIVT